MARNEQHDDVEEMEEGDMEEESTELEAGADDETPVAAPSARGEDDPDERTVASRDRLRQELSQDVEAFLARGGKISYIEPNVVADPPRKPEGDYGSRPL